MQFGYLASLFLFSAESKTHFKKDKEKKDFMRRTFFVRSLFKARRVHEPPLNGYEVSELPSEKIFEEYMRRFGSNQLVVAVLHSGSIPVTIGTSPAAAPIESNTNSKVIKPTSVLHPSTQKAAPKDVFDPVARSLISGFNLVNLGHPDDVKVVTVPGNLSPTMVSAYHVLAYPTSLIFFRNKYVDKVVGCRFDEVATKCLFTLRNNNCNIYSSNEFKLDTE